MKERKRNRLPGRIYVLRLVRVERPCTLVDAPYHEGRGSAAHFTSERNVPRRAGSSVNVIIDAEECKAFYRRHHARQISFLLVHARSPNVSHFLTHPSQMQPEGRTWRLAALSFASLGTVTWIAHGLTPPTDTPRTFSVVSNAAFAADGVLVPMVAIAHLVETHPMVYATTLVSTMLAAGSFAHHLDRRLAPAHTLDIAMGWVLYVHLAFLAVFALVRRVLLTFGIVWPHLLLAFTLAESGAILALFSSYDHVRRNQVWLLVGCGALTHCCTLAHRLIFDAGARPTRAVLDFAALLVLQAVAATVQGELWYQSLSPRRYDIEHGYWHLINGTIVTVVVFQTVHLLRRPEALPDDLPHTAPEKGEAAYRSGLVVFALVLLAVTLENPTATEWTASIVTTQVALLCASLATCAMSSRRSRNMDVDTARRGSRRLGTPTPPHAADPSTATRLTSVR